MQSFLIIDDEENIRSLLHNVLKRNFTCRISEAVNGQKGLELIKNDIPDLVFLDISMPVMDGKQTLEAIRANSLYKKTAVIMLTAHSDKNNIGIFAQLGISDYMVKPIDIHDLVKRVKKILSVNESMRHEKISTSIPEILLVESDRKFRDLIKYSFGKGFIIHEAANGSEALNIYTKYLPRYILVSNRVGLLDKKIIIQKIKEDPGSGNVNIYLILDQMNNISHKVFAFDGYLKWNNDPDQFINEFEKLTRLKISGSNETELNQDAINK